MTLHLRLLAIVFLFTSCCAVAQEKSEENTEPTALFHVILLKWKDGSDPLQRVEMETLWSGLTRKVSGFDSFEINAVEDGAYHHVVILQFSDRMAFQQYQSHTDHTKIKEIGKLIVADVSTYTYWH